jgi:DNA-binding transcriptional LysR family regulator
MLDRLTLDQLRVLAAVADKQSFSAAARQLGRVQSAISQSVQTLEATLGIPLFDRSGRTPKLTEAGRVILEDARKLLRNAEMLRARAAEIATDVEPELTLAIDAIFPNKMLMASLKALGGPFPCLAVSLFTEGLGAPEQRLRDGVARLGIATVATGAGGGIEREFLAWIEMVPVAAPGHPLAQAGGLLERELVEREIQLVLTDRSPLTSNLSGGIVSHRIWRFADQVTRLDYLLAGFGWCNMPLHLVAERLAAGDLKRLDLREGGGRLSSLPLYVMYERSRAPGRAGRWLIEDLRRRLAAGEAPGIKT